MIRTLFALLIATACTGTEVEVQTVVVGSCLHQRPVAPALDAMIALQGDLTLLLGDNVYADTRDPDAMRAAYALQAQRPQLAALRAAGPLLTTWDDHDYGENDAGADYPMKDAAREIFLDFWQVPHDSPRRAHPGVYHAETFGQPGRRVQVLLLDTRFFRSPIELGDLRNSTVLGDQQWAWLEEQLRQPAELRLLCSSIQVVADSHKWEKWANFPHQRQRLFELIRETGASGVIALSGDRHHASLMKLDAGLPYPLYDLTASGLNVRCFPDEPDPKRIGEVLSEHNFGSLAIDWGDEPAVTLRIHQADGAIHLEHRVPLAELQP